MRLAKNLLAGLALSLSLVSDAFSEETAQPDDMLQVEDIFFQEIKVASILSENVFNSVSNVSVLDRETIERYNFSTMAEALNSFVGMEVRRDALVANIPIVRGILSPNYGNKVLYMINNVPTWNSITGEARIERINIHDVERIELLRGPASVLYGTNAYAGAVNVILKNSEKYTAPKDSGEVYLTAGDKRTFQAGGNISSVREKGRYNVFANASDEGGRYIFFQPETGGVERKNEFIFRGGNMTVDARYGGSTVLVNGYRGATAGFGSPITFGTGINHPWLHTGYVASYGYQKDIGKLTLSLNSLYDWFNREFSSTRDNTQRRNVEGHRIAESLKSVVRVTDSLTVELGGDYDFRKSHHYATVLSTSNAITSESGMQNISLYEYSGYTQVGYGMGPLHLLAGARLTHNELFGNNLSSRGTAVWTISPKNSLKAIVAQSFRAPTLFELYFRSANNSAFGYPGLDPETATSYELAYLTTLGRLFGQLTGYYTVYEGKIDRTTTMTNPFTGAPLGVPGTVHVNLPKFISRGLELELKYRNPRIVNGFLSAEYIFSDNELASDNFRYAPLIYVTAGLDRNFGPFFASGKVNFSGHTNGAFNPINAFTTGDLTLGFKPKSKHNITHMISVKNVTDEAVQYSEYVRRTIDTVPSEYRKRIMYTITAKFE